MSFRFVVRGVAAAVAGLSASVLITAINPAAAQTSYRVGIFNLAPFGGDPPGGYCYDLMNTIGERLGWQFEFVPMNATDLISRLGAGEIDMNCSALAATNPRREQGVAFTGPILTNRETVLVRAEVNANYVSFADLQGLRVGAPVNSAFLQSLQTAGFTDVRSYPGLPEAVAALIAGEIDAYVTISSGFLYNHDVQGMWPEVKAVETWVSTFVNYGTLAVRAGNTELLGILQNELEAMKLDGALSATIAPWGLVAPPF